MHPVCTTCSRLSMNIWTTLRLAEVHTAPSHLHEIPVPKGTRLRFGAGMKLCSRWTPRFWRRR